MGTKNKKYMGIYLDENDKPIPNEEPFIGWNSRACAVTVIIASEDCRHFLFECRGPGCPDNVGKLCFPCGYLDWDETTQEAAVREVYEEIGARINPDKLEFIGYQDSPSANRQNITFRFLYKVPFKELWNLANNYSLTDASERGGEANEVSELVLVHPTPDMGTVDSEYAFGHNKLMLDVLRRHMS